MNSELPREGDNSKRFTLGRRPLVKGAAWTVPAVTVAAAAPAFAASGLTGSKDTAYFYFSEYNYGPANCGSGNYNSGGFIDTQGTTPSGGPVNGSTKDGDGLLNPNSSIGYWLETSNSSSGSAQICNITTTYTFSSPIVIDNCPLSSYSQNGTWRWTQCETLNGWTYSLSSDGKTLTMKYNTCANVQTSTSTSGTGTYVPGYFINYHFTSVCTTNTTQTVASSTTFTWSDGTVTNQSFSKNTSATKV